MQYYQVRRETRNGDNRFIETYPGKYATAHEANLQVSRFAEMESKLYAEARGIHIVAIHYSGQSFYMTGPKSYVEFSRSPIITGE